MLDIQPSDTFAQGDWGAGAQILGKVSMDTRPEVVIAAANTANPDTSDLKSLVSA